MVTAQRDSFPASRMPRRGPLRRFAGGPGGPAGVTLMEVLISIFILAVGLFGVAALLPVGGADIMETVKADRAAAVGAAALRDARVRKIIEPFQWSATSHEVIPMWFQGGIPYSGSSAQYVLIDPLGVAAQGWTIFPLPSGVFVIMPRVTLRSAPVASASFLSLEGARELFVSKDDVLFDIPSDRRLRARLLYRPVGAGNPPVMNDPTTYNPNTHRPESEGNYSWMLMLSPAPGENTSTGYCRVLCSVIVFYKRNLGPQNDNDPNTPEALASVEVLGSGYGGGDTRITLTHQAHASRLQKDHWILLVSRQNGPPPDGRVFQWYRIVAVAPDPNNALRRYVTLAGPDWTAGSVAQAILMEGVVGVYSRVVEMERGF